MKSRYQTNSTSSRLAPMIRLGGRLPKALAASALSGCIVLLSGCGLILPHTRTVSKIVVIPNALNATLDQLLEQIATQYNSVQSITATVDITASTGGQHEGEVKENPAFTTYIVMRKPADMHIQMLVPVFRSRALDMVSDGKDFKLYLPTKNRAVIGKDEPTEASKTGYENLRPYIIRDALLIPPLQSDEEVGLVNDSRIIPPAPGHKEALEEPDYDLIVSRHKQGQQQEIVRVVHIGRATLRPYEQDIYDHEGRPVTIVKYDKYQKFGDRFFPASIVITRPLDEYTLKIDFAKITFNLNVDDDSFLLKIPDSVPVQDMNNVPAKPTP